ncbi:unnamed protein product [Amoebophrya sp. A25]|nr:unnamed protein product [Amoebophrya sp. A25]|eukprot:GSA25T00027206001.1
MGGDEEQEHALDGSEQELLSRCSSTTTCVTGGTSIWSSSLANSTPSPVPGSRRSCVVESALSRQQQSSNPFASSTPSGSTTSSGVRGDLLQGYQQDEEDEDCGDHLQGQTNLSTILDEANHFASNSALLQEHVRAQGGGALRTATSSAPVIHEDKPLEAETSSAWNPAQKEAAADELQAAQLQEEMELSFSAELDLHLKQVAESERRKRRDALQQEEKERKKERSNCARLRQEAEDRGLVVSPVRAHQSMHAWRGDSNCSLARQAEQWGNRRTLRELIAAKKAGRTAKAKTKKDVLLSASTASTSSESSSSDPTASTTRTSLPQTKETPGGGSLQQQQQQFFASDDTSLTERGIVPPKTLKNWLSPMDMKLHGTADVSDEGLADALNLKCSNAIFPIAWEDVAALGGGEKAHVDDYLMDLEQLFCSRVAFIWARRQFENELGNIRQIVRLHQATETTIKKLEEKKKLEEGGPAVRGAGRSGGGGGQQLLSQFENAYRKIPNPYYGAAGKMIAPLPPTSTWWFSSATSWNGDAVAAASGSGRGSGRPLPPLATWALVKYTGLSTRPLERTTGDGFLRKRILRNGGLFFHDPLFGSPPIGEGIWDEEHDVAEKWIQMQRDNRIVFGQAGGAATTSTTNGRKKKKKEQKMSKGQLQELHVKDQHHQVRGAKEATTATTRSMVLPTKGGLRIKGLKQVEELEARRSISGTFVTEDGLEVQSSGIERSEKTALRIMAEGVGMGVDPQALNVYGRIELDERKAQERKNEEERKKKILAEVARRTALRKAAEEHEEAASNKAEEKASSSSLTEEKASQLQASIVLTPREGDIKQASDSTMVASGAADGKDHLKVETSEAETVSKDFASTAKEEPNSMVTFYQSPTFRNGYERVKLETEQRGAALHVFQRLACEYMDDFPNASVDWLIRQWFQILLPQVLYEQAIVWHKVWLRKQLFLPAAGGGGPSKKELIFRGEVKTETKDTAARLVGPSRKETSRRTRNLLATLPKSALDRINAYHPVPESCEDLTAQEEYALLEKRRRGEPLLVPSAYHESDVVADWKPSEGSKSFLHTTEERMYVQEMEEVYQRTTSGGSPDEEKGPLPEASYVNFAFVALKKWWPAVDPVLGLDMNSRKYEDFHLLQRMTELFADYERTAGGEVYLRWQGEDLKNLRNLVPESPQHILGIANYLFLHSFEVMDHFLLRQ